MDKEDEIKIYKVVSVSDLHKHYPAIRHTLFGMAKDEVGDFICSVNEFGHVLGLYDEYKSENPIEQSGFWKDNQYNDDKAAIMNQELGNELRDRYFEHYLQAVQEFDTASNYQLGRIQTQ